MKQKLEELATELIDEVKNLKDLAKAELPEIAKEYLHFQLTSSLWLAGASALGVVCCATFGLLHKTELPKDQDDFIACMLFLAFSCSIPLILNLYNAARIKLMPRTSAIEGVTKLFKP